jgi:hypothetical protein
MTLPYVRVESIIMQEGGESWQTQSKSNGYKYYVLYILIEDILFTILQ